MEITSRGPGRTNHFRVSRGRKIRNILIPSTSRFDALSFDPKDVDEDDEDWYKAVSGPYWNEKFGAADLCAAAPLLLTMQAHI